ncbi:MAG: PEP-CTERM sorting domain-containing protein [Pirellulales bacterium]|nr:PEP-CTERM sorting domain-containing protein [Pirellulales bacterium]
MPKLCVEVVAGLVTCFWCAGQAIATPYASNVRISGTDVSFILNEPADTLTYSINGGLPVALDGSSGGAKVFTLGAPTDTFSIVAEKTAYAGFTIGDGGTVTPTGSGLSFATNSSTFVPISDDFNTLTAYNSPRGVAVNRNPNQPDFGTAYITNSAVGTPSGRSLQKGVYALRADQSDAFGYGDTAQQSAFFSTSTTPNTPYKPFVGPDGNVYVAGFGDAISGVFQLSPDLLTLTNVLTGTSGTRPLASGANHGSVLKSVVTGTTAGNDLTVYTIDEDLTTSQVTGAGSTTDTNSLWSYSIGGGALPHSAMPTKVASPLIGEGFTIIDDLDRGADGKFYLTQSRSQPATVGGIFVVDPSGTVLFDSRTASLPIVGTTSGDYNYNGVVDAADFVIWRAQEGQSGAGLAADGDGSGTVDAADYDHWRTRFGNTTGDIFSSIFGIAVSPDQEWLAAIHNNGTISVLPLVNGIPDVANRLAVVTTPTINSSRGIAFDAAGNLHYVSSGQARYRVLAPGGHTVATTSWNGSQYSFGLLNSSSGLGSGGSVPEPASLGLLMTAIAWICVRRVR